MVSNLRKVGNRLWEWFTLANVSRLADLAAKLAAIVVAVVGVNFLSSSAHVAIVKAECRSVVDRNALAKLWASPNLGSPHSVPANELRFAELFPPGGATFSSATRVNPHGDRTVVSCRPLFEGTSAFRHSDEAVRNSFKTYHVTEGVFPRDFAKATIYNGGPLTLFEEVPTMLLSTYTEADITVANHGDGTATDVTLTSIPYNMTSSSFRLRAGERRTIVVATKPGVRGYVNGNIRVRWDSVREVNQPLIDGLLVAFAAFLAAVFLRDVFAPASGD